LAKNATRRNFPNPSAGNQKRVAFVPIGACELQFSLLPAVSHFTTLFAKADKKPIGLKFIHWVARRRLQVSQLKNRDDLSGLSEGFQKEMFFCRNVV